jgi:hypothetical protein
MFHIHPYNLGSRSAKALKEYLTDQGFRVIISHRLRSDRKRMIVGWGARSLDFPLGHNVLVNDPNITKILSCKKRFFEHVSNGQVGAYLPEFTSDRNVAGGWGDTVVVRHSTTASGGEGIELVEPGQEMPNAPLYTRYQKKTAEYRLHVLGGEVKEIQRKVFVKTDERPEPEDWRIRNHTKGFIFQTEPDCPDIVREAALAVNAVFGNGLIGNGVARAGGLDFSALDVIYHKPTNRALVLEGNTAPGLEGPRVSVYGDYLIKKYKELM